jgi:hypothetical protein
MGEYGSQRPSVVGECDEDFCITCSDAAVEVTVLRLAAEGWRWWTRARARRK